MVKAGVFSLSLHTAVMSEKAVVKENEKLVRYQW